MDAEADLLPTIKKPKQDSRDPTEHPSKRNDSKTMNGTVGDAEALAQLGKLDPGMLLQLIQAAQAKTAAKETSPESSEDVEAGKLESTHKTLGADKTAVQEEMADAKAYAHTRHEVLTADLQREAFRCIGR